MHTRQVNLPLYAIATDLAGAHVLRGARNFIRRSKVTRRESMLVDATAPTSHLDPLTAAPKTNAFLKTVVPFLDRKVFGRRFAIDRGHKRPPHTTARASPLAR